MGRARGQNGWVEVVGSAPHKAWRGHYYEYRPDAAGKDKRHHKIVDLGQCGEMSKFDARKKLLAHIESEGKAVVEQAETKTADESWHTLGWFWEKRFRPMAEPRWKPTARGSMVHYISLYVVRPFESRELASLEKAELQMHLNAAAEKYSHSIVVKFRTWMKALLDEAVEQGYIDRNPAARLKMPKTRPVGKRVLTAEEMRAIVEHMEPRGRLAVRLMLSCALRPGECFALRRDDYTPGNLRVDETTREGAFDKAKTEASMGFVALPPDVETELVKWLAGLELKEPSDLIFPSAAGDTPLRMGNFLRREVKPAAARAVAKLKEDGLPVPEGFLCGVNHQVFRRTCLTFLQDHAGNPKIAQAHARHASPVTTMREYAQSVPDSVRAAVAEVEALVFGGKAKTMTAGK